MYIYIYYTIVLGIKFGKKGEQNYEAQNIELRP